MYTARLATGLIRVVIPSLVAIASGIGPSPDTALGIERTELPAFDSRSDDSPNPREPEFRHALSELKARLSGEVVELEPATGTLGFLTRHEGALSKQSSAPESKIAKRWLLSHLRVIGIDRADLHTLHFAGQHKIAGNTTIVSWDQSFRGIGAFDNSLKIIVENGRVRSISGQPAHNLAVPSIAPHLSATQALDIVARKARSIIPDAPEGSSPEVPSITRGPTGRSHRTVFTSGDSAELVIFKTSQSSRLAWRVNYTHGPGISVRTVVDAFTGRRLYQANAVAAAHNDARLWDYYPGAPKGGTPKVRNLSPWIAPNSGTLLRGPTILMSLPPMSVVWPPGVFTPHAVQRLATPNGDWIATRNPWPATNGATCAAAGCSWSPSQGFSWVANFRQAAIQAFYFASRFQRHLAQKPISFKGTPKKGPFRFMISWMSNVNANLGTIVGNLHAYALADGSCSTVGIDAVHLGPTGPPTNSSAIIFGESADTVFHEVQHLASASINPNAFCLSQNQGLALNESLADWSAFDFLIKSGLIVDKESAGDVKFVYHGDAQTQPLDCTLGAAVICPPRRPGRSGGLTYADYGKHQGFEPHRDGEILTQTLFEIRRRLTKKLGVVAGTQLLERLVWRAIAAVPKTPTFLNFRDAILAANHTKSIEQIIWRIFAKRGMGVGARAKQALPNIPQAQWENYPRAGFGIPKKYRPPAPTLKGPTKCFRKTLKARVRGAQMMRLTFSLDNQLLKTVNVRPTDHSHSVTQAIAVNGVKAGKHQLGLRLDFVYSPDVPSKTLTANVRRCK